MPGLITRGFASAEYINRGTGLMKRKSPKVILMQGELQQTKGDDNLLSTTPYHKNLPECPLLFFLPAPQTRPPFPICLCCSSLALPVLPAHTFLRVSLTLKPDSFKLFS